MTSPQQIEVAIRAGKLAKTALDITNTSRAKTAKLMLVEVVEQLQQLSDKLREFSAMEKD